MKTATREALDLAARVAELERERDLAVDTLGTVLTTLCLSRNREQIEAGDAGAVRSLFDLADRWMFNFKSRFGKPQTEAPK